MDAYAGTGALGIEALSRGAERVLLEKHQAALDVIREPGSDSCGSRAVVVPGPVLKTLAGSGGHRFNSAAVRDGTGYRAVLELLGAAPRRSPLRNIRYANCRSEWGRWC